MVDGQEMREAYIVVRDAADAAYKDAKRERSNAAITFLT
jgi:hypothetical protein